MTIMSLPNNYYFYETQILYNLFEYEERSEEGESSMWQVDRNNYRCIRISANYFMTIMSLPKNYYFYETQILYNLFEYEERSEERESSMWQVDRNNYGCIRISANYFMTIMSLPNNYYFCETQTLYNLFEYEERSEERESS